jgi:methylated-DNA-protein-cysteine methyltransferase-like protein
MNFRQKVIYLVQHIPEGKVTTYGTIASVAGQPRGARLVGGIIHQASEKEELPWQRVINRHGFISIKCFDHPKELQRALLQTDGVEVSSEFMVDLNKYGWWGEEILDSGELEK